MVFRAGLIGAILGSVAGVCQKRRAPQTGPLLMEGTAVAVFVLTAIGAPPT